MKLKPLSEIVDHPRFSPYFFLFDDGKLSPDGEWESKAFFQLYPDEVMYAIKPGEADLLDILVLCKLFPSKSQARGAGWKQEIPYGFSDWKIGKLKTELTMFRWSKDDSYARMMEEAGKEPPVEELREEILKEIYGRSKTVRNGIETES